MSMLVPFLLLIVLSAFFSASETAIFSLSLLARERMKHQAKPFLRRLLRLVQHKPDELLVSVLSGNMLANLFATACYENLIQDRVVIQEEWQAVVFPIVSMTLILLIFGELLPKRLAVIRPQELLKRTAFLQLVFYKVLSPLHLPLSWMRRLLTVKLTSRENEQELLRATLRIGLREGSLSEREYQIFDSFLSLNTLTAEDIMVPRTEIPAIEVSQSLAEILAYGKRLLSYEPTSFLLVYRDNLDQPLGYLDLKDLLQAQLNPPPAADWTQLVQPCHLVPRRKKLNQLLYELKEKKLALALVVDEYGGTAGLVSYRQLAETILSFADAGREQLTPLSKNLFIIPGRYKLKKLEQRLGFKFNSKARTVAGLIMDVLGEIPSEGTKVRIGPALFLVRRMQHNRVQLVLVEVVKT